MQIQVSHQRNERKKNNWITLKKFAPNPGTGRKWDICSINLQTTKNRNKQIDVFLEIAPSDTSDAQMRTFVLPSSYSSSSCHWTSPCCSHVRRERSTIVSENLVFFGRSWRSCWKRWRERNQLKSRDSPAHTQLNLQKVPHLLFGVISSWKSRRVGIVEQGTLCLPVACNIFERGLLRPTTSLNFRAISSLGHCTPTLDSSTKKRRAA